jgi:hypothetical protein
VSGGIVVLLVSGDVVGGAVVVVVVSIVVVFVVESIVVLSLVSEALRVELHAVVAIINEPITARLKIVFFIGIHLDFKI